MTGITGSPAYSSPETNEYGINTFKSDVYSFGCIIYFICTEKVYFYDKIDIKNNNNIKNDDIRELFIQCVNNNPDSRPDTSVILRKMIQICTKNCIDDYELLKHGIIFECDAELENFIRDQFNKESEKKLVLGIVYKNGYVLPCNIKRAIYYLELAADQNESEALYKLSEIYYSLPEPDITKFLHYLKLACLKNNADAEYTLGVLYFQGRYVDQDINKCIK